MPTTVNVAGRGTITFDDNVSDEEIQQIVQKEFPVSGEDVVRSIAEDPSYAQRMSRDDFMEMRRYKEDKPVDFSAKLAEAFGGIGELVSNAFTTAPKFDPQAGPIEKGASLVANIGQGAMVGAGDFGNMFISVLEGYSNDDNSYSRYRLANDLKDTQENRAEYDRIIDSDFESFKGLQTWQQSRKDILGQASMPAMAETISLVAQPPLPGAALLQVAGVGARIGEVGARVAQMGGKGIQAVGKATTAAANAPQRVAGAAVKALTESKEIAGKVEKIIATGSTGLAAFQLGGFSIPGLSTTATTIALGKAVGNALEVAGEVTQKIAEHAGKKAGRLGVFESLANDLSASTAARAIGRVGSVAGADIVAPYVSAAIQGAAEGAIIGGTIGFITDGEEGAAGGMGAGLALGGAGGLAGRGYAQASGMIRQNKIVNDALRGIASLDPQNRANASRLFDQFIKDGNQEAVAEMVDAKNWLSSDVYFSFINNEQAKAMPAADGTSFEGITVFPSAVTGGKPAIYINVDTVKPGTGFHESFHGAMRTALGETFGKKFTEVIDQTFTPEEKVQFAEDYIKRGGTEEGKQKLRDYLAEKQNLPEEIGAEYFREFLQRRENRDLLLRGQRTTDGSLIAATKGAIDYTLSKLGIDYDATGTGYKGMDALASELIKARTDINKSIAQNGKPLAPVPLDKMATPKLADWAKQHGQSDVLLKDPTTGDVIGVKTEEQVNIGRDAANARAAEEIANVPRGTNAPNDAELAIYQKYFPLEQFLKLTFASEAIKSGNVLNGDYFPATAKKGETSVYASRGMTNLDFVPYKIRTTKKNVVVVDYVDLTQLKARFDDVMSRSKILDQWGGDKDAAWQDVMAYTKNLSLGEGVAKPSAELFGPIKRDIINKIYGFVPTKAQVSEGTIKNISSLGTNIAAESGTGKSQIGKPAYEGSRDTRVVSTMRLDRLGRIADTGRQFSFNENGTYGLSQVNFKPAENLGSAKVNNSDEGFRIITKGAKHSLYAPTGERIGIYDTQAGAERKANVSAAKLQPEIRQQQSDSESFTISRSDMGRFMPASDKVKLEDYADRKIVALAADRMGIGQMSVGPKGEKRDLSLLGQGGRGFMNIFNGGGWAFSDQKTADRFISRLKKDADRNGNATVGITIQSPINHLKNQTGQLAYIEAMQAAIDSKTITRRAADAQIAAMSSAIVNSNAKSIKASAREKFSQINTLKELKKVVEGRGLNFADMDPLLTQMQRKKLPITEKELSEMGMTAADIARDLADPELTDLPFGSVVALLGVNVNQAPTKTGFHYSYPWTVHGDAIGFLDKFYNIADLSTEKRIRNKSGAVTAQPLQTVMPIMDNIVNTIKTKQGIPSVPSARFMPSDAPESKFYGSRIISAVENSSQGKASGSQWKATIKNSKLGVNQDEYALVGVGDLEDGKTYTKTEVLDYLRANEVVVKDVTLGGGKYSLEEAQQLRKELDFEARRIFPDTRKYGDTPFHGDHIREGRTTHNALQEYLAAGGNEKLAADAAEAWQNNTGSQSTHFSSYTLPGAKEGSYREVLLTVPESSQVKLVPVDDGSGWWRVIDKEGDQVGSGATPENAMANAREDGASGEWRDGHSQYSDIPNPIVRLRHNERTTSDGKRMLFIEEIQAPQKGQFEKMPALFQKNWREIAFKWALRTAADNGFDSVGYTTGKQQADRYDLSKEVRHIDYMPLPSGEKFVGVTLSRGSGGFSMNVKDGIVVASRQGAEQFEGKPLDQVVGKELAKRIAEGTNGRIEGEGLNVGGEGLKKLYDQDFRNVVNNLPVVKKSGQKVGMVELPGIGRNPLNNKPGGIQEITTGAVHSINVAPEMRNASVNFMPDDADYLAAVKSGDMKVVQGMVDEAAKAAGYTTKVFHGTISQFNKPNTPLFLGDEGTAMSYAKDRAMGYGEGANPVTYKIYAKFKNTASESDVKKAATDLGLEVENDMAFTALDPKISGSKYVSQVISELKKRSYDSANIDDFLPDNPHKVIKSFVAFDPSQLKLADPITKDNAGNVIPLSQRFNTKSEDIRFMPSVEFSAPEKLPNGQAWSTNMNYRVIQKTGGKYRVYAPIGTLIGVTESLEQAKRLIEKRNK